MRKIKILGSIMALIMIFTGCEKVKDPAGQRDIAVIPFISDINPGIFNSKDLKNSFVEFKLGLETGKHADKAIIEGSYKDNYERIKLAEATSFPATIRIVSGDIVQKLGITEADIINGDFFQLEVLITSNGVTTRSKQILHVVVSCPYDNALTVGSYHSVSPPSDWNSEGDITITADPDNQYKLYVTGLEANEGLVEDQGPLVMYLDPATNVVTVPKKVLSSDAWGYGSISYVGDGAYNSCDGSYVMHFDIGLETLGSQGIYLFTFTRNAK
jgi:hypothetical protein